MGIQLRDSERRMRRATGRVTGKKIRHLALDFRPSALNDGSMSPFRQNQGKDSTFGIPFGLFQIIGNESFKN
jgi:hypothetical protein